MRAIPLMPDSYLHAALDAPHGEERAMLIREAWSWMYTPWMHENRVKGRGADCGNFIAGAFANAGLIEDPPLYRYPHDFYLHDDRELFREVVAGFCEKIRNPQIAQISQIQKSAESAKSEDSPLPGDVVAVAGGKLEVTHLAIVVAWPIVIHALRRPAGCVTLDDGDRGQLAHRQSGIWRLKRWC